MLESEKKLKLSDLIEVHFLQEFQDAFAKTMNIASLTYDDNGPVTKPTGFTDFCYKYTRKSEIGASRCKECDMKWGNIAATKGEPVIYKCHAGLTDFAVPIIVEGKQYGTIYGGQILTEKPDEKRFREIAREIGVDEDEYIEALKKINIVPKKRVEQAAKLLYIVANILSEIGHKNFELIEKNKKADLYRRIIETVRSSLDIDETKQKIINIVGKTLNADRCFVTEFDKESDKYLIVRDEYLSSDKILSFKGVDVNVEIPHFAAAVKQGKPLIINNKEIFLQTENQDFEVEKKVIEKYGVTSVFAFPLFYFEDFLGVLAIHYVDKPHIITSDEINLITMIADQVAIALHQAKMYKITQLQAEREKLYRSIMEAIRSSLDIDKTKQQICDIIGKTLQADRCFVMEYDKKNDRFLTINDEYVSSDEITAYKGADVNKEVPHFAEALKQGKPIFIKDKEIFLHTENQNFDLEKEAIKRHKVNAALAFPLYYFDELLGALVLHYVNQKFYLSGDEIPLIDTIADQVAIAMHQAKMYKITQDQAERELILRKTIEIIRSSIDLDFVKHEMVFQIGTFLNADRVAFADYDFTKENYFTSPGDEYRSSTDVKTFVGYDFAATPGFIEAIRTLHLTGKDIVFSDLDKYIEENHLQDTGIEQFYKYMGFMSSMAININHGDMFYGNLVVTFSEKRDISEEDIKIVRTLADQAGIAIYQSTLYQKQKQTAEREALLRKIFETIRSTLDLNELFELICNELAKVFNIQRSFIVEFKKDNSHNESIIQKEFKAGPEIKGLRDEGFDQRTVEYWGEILLEEGKTIIIDNIPESDTPDYFKETYKNIGLKSIMGFAIKQGEDKWGWVGVSEYNYYRHWTEDEITVLETISSQIYMAIKQAELYKATQENAQRDSLLRNITETIRSSLDIDETLAFICEETAKLFKVQRSAITAFPNKKNLENFDTKKEYKSDPEIKGIAQDGIFPKLATYWGENLIKSDNALSFDNVKESDIPDYFKKGYDEMGVKSIMGTCIRKGKDAWGMLVLSEYNQYRHWTDEEKTLLKTIGAQIYIAINQAELFEKEKISAERERLIAKVVSEAISTFDINQIKQMVKDIGIMTKADRCYFVEVDVDNMKGKPIDSHREYLSSPDIKSIVGYEFSTEDVKKFVEMYLSAKDLIVFDYVSILQQQSDQFDGMKRYINQSGLKSAVGIPFYYRDKLIAVLAIEYITEKINPSDDELNFLRILANQIGMAFSQIQLYQNTKKTAENEKVLREIMLSSVSVFDTKEIIKSIVTEAGELFNADRCFFTEINAQNDSILPSMDAYEYDSSTDIKSLKTWNVTADETAVFLDEILQKEVVVVEDIDKMDLPDITRTMLVEGFAVKSYAIIPVYYGGIVYGALVLHYVHNFKHFTQNDIDMVQAVANQSAIVIHQAKLYEQTQAQAEREKISKNIIEILRSTIDKSTIKHLFVQNIGKYFKADRVFFSDFDPQSKMYLPVDADSEYLSNNEVKSFVDYDWSDSSLKEYIQPLLEKRELKIPCWCEYIKENPKSHGFISRFEDANVKSSYNIPVLYQQQMMGYFCIEFAKDSCNVLSNEDISSIRSMCTQAGIALYHASLYVQLQESSRSKEEFIANISNELNSPLNSLIEFSEILSKSEFDCSKQIEYLNNINQTSSELLELRNDILIISTIESENFKLNYENIDSEKLIMEVIGCIRPSADKKEISVGENVGNMNINVDKKMLNQIFYNLLNTAIKLTPPKGKITINSKPENNKLVISIEVSGLGMSIDNQNMIFEKFKQLDSSYPRRQKGVGLELSIATKLVELHKGSISVESTNDNGTLIRFVLPNTKI